MQENDYVYYKSLGQAMRKILIKKVPVNIQSTHELPPIKNVN